MIYCRMPFVVFTIDNYDHETVRSRSPVYLYNSINLRAFDMERNCIDTQYQFCTRTKIFTPLNANNLRRTNIVLSYQDRLQKTESSIFTEHRHRQTRFIIVHLTYWYLVCAAGWLRCLHLVSFILIVKRDLNYEFAPFLCIKRKNKIITKYFVQTKA